MLDVHPAHHAASTWKDFFIHIATIVLGLLIAVGLESLVEQIHHHHQVTETRGLLRDEREGNKKNFADLASDWRGNTALLRNNLLVLDYLRQHPGTPEEKLPGVLRWGHHGTSFDSVVWDAAQQNGVVALMPRDEAAKCASVYRWLKRVKDADDETSLALNDALRYQFSDRNPSHLSPVQVDEEIDRTQIALMKSFQAGAAMQNISALMPDFPPSITLDELHQLSNSPDKPTLDRLAAASALTDARLKASGRDVRMKLTPAVGCPSIQPTPRNSRTHV
jgi:GTPase SAR1 family protein